MFKRFSAALYSIYNQLVTHDIYKINIGKWFALGGDEKYILKHNLNGQSVVFDVGGFTGVFSDSVIIKYDPEIYIFEPVEKYYAILCEKYKSNKKAHIFKFGLADKTYEDKINLLDDKTSVFGSSESKESVKITDINTFFQEHPEIVKVDLMSINIEGGEYALLTRLIDTGLIAKIDFIQVQFHKVVENYAALRESLVSKLKQTHTQKFSFPFVWDGFEKKHS